MAHAVQIVVLAALATSLLVACAVLAYRIDKEPARSNGGKHCG